MHSVIRTSLLAATFALMTPALMASPATPDLELIGTSPALPGSLGSLDLDFTNQTLTWSSDDTLNGSIDFVAVAPQVWTEADGRLTFRYVDGTGRALIGNVLRAQPDRTVVDLIASGRTRYLMKRDPGSVPVVNLADLSVSEEAGVARLTLSLNAEPLQPASVDFTCAPGTAGLADFDSSPGTVIIPAGRRTITLSIPLVNDLRVERVEEFTVTLGNPQRVTIGDGTATVSIEDVDTTTVSVFDTHVDEDTFGVRIPIRLSAPSDFNIVVGHRTPSGTAIAGVDFRPRENDTTFTPGQLEYMLFVPPINDAEVEGTETFLCRLFSISGERASLGRDEGTISIFDDESPKEPRVDEIGWQWPNNAVYRPELTHEQYLMTAGTLIGAVNFGHGTPGSILTVAGIPLTNTGAGVGNPSGALAAGVSYSVTDAPTADDGLGFPGLDDLFFSQVSGPLAARLEVTGLDPAKRYVVQLFFGEPRGLDARHWNISTDLGFSGDVGGPLRDYVRRQFGQGPLGDGSGGQNPPAREDRRIISFGLCQRESFLFDNQAWSTKEASFSGFQIREVFDYPLSPDVHTPERVGGLLWTGTQLVAVADEGDILTGPETMEFTAQNSGNSEILGDVISVGGTLLVVGNRGTVITSTDHGVTWTPQVSNASRQLWGATDIGSLVVVTGDDGTIITSTDLVTWTPRDSGTTENIGSGAWNGSLLVIVGDRGTVLTSPDGINYTTFQIPGANNINLNSLIWDGTQFLAAGRERFNLADGLLFTSPDGLTWTQSAFVARAPLTGLFFDGTKYLVGDQNGSIYTSPDAVTWTEQIPVPNDGVRNIVWTGTRYVVGCQNGDFMWSVDGVTWSSETGVTNPSPALAGGDYDAWAASQGLPPGSHDSDLNRDGFANLFHYAMGVPAHKLLTRELPGLLPSVDTSFLPGRATVAFRLPEDLPPDLRLEVEKSSDGQAWSVIASRAGSSTWESSPEHLVVEDESASGYRLTRFPTATNDSQQPLVLFRLRVTKF